MSVDIEWFASLDLWAEVHNPKPTPASLLVGCIKALCISPFRTGSTDIMGSAHGDAACEEGVHDDDSTLVCLGTLIAQVFFPDLAERSVFISAQLDCIEEGGDFSQVKVPAGPGRLWVRCLVRAPAALQGADNGRLASFLKVRFSLFSAPHRAMLPYSL